jgi:hypothetical protein
MKKGQTATIQRRTSGGTWAERLAVRWHAPVGTPMLAASDEVLDAISALWALFDEATQEANAALARAGSPEQLTIQRSGAEGTYRLAGPNGIRREIRITLTINISQGQRYGGATITTSHTRAYIYLEPVKADEQMRWRVGDTAPEFTAEIVHDLFLSVFADDPAATQRLSPLSGMDLFQVPWNC